MGSGTGTDRNGRHWRRLGLLPGAPECVIKAAHRSQIEQHHPDRGGDAQTATEINVAYDALRGSGSAAAEYVAANYHGEPWVVIGITSVAGMTLAERAGRQLIAELGGNRRLVARVEWAVANFERVQPKVRPRAQAPPPPRATRPRGAAGGGRTASEPARPGAPEGLPPRVDFGRVAWGSDVVRKLQLTWRHYPPFGVTVEAPGPLRAEVTSSKVLPGRFSVACSIDWASPELAGGATRGYPIEGELVVRWTSSDEARVPVTGLILFPAAVTVSPQPLDLGTAKAGQPVRGSIVVASTGAASVTLESPAWLRRVDGAGRPLDGPLRVAAGAPVRVEFRVHWPPVLERGEASLAARRPVRPTGRIVVRWEGGETVVAATFIATPK